MPATPPGGPSSPGSSSAMPLLTVAEVADMLRVSKMTVYRMIHSGELPSLQARRSMRVPRVAVEQYMSSGLGDWSNWQNEAFGS